MKPVLCYAALIFAIVFAFTACKKASESTPVNPNDIYYTRMARMRHWSGTESYSSPSGSSTAAIYDSFAVQVIDHENIVVYATPLVLVDTINGYLEFQAGTSDAVRTLMYDKATDKISYGYSEHMGLEHTHNISLNSD